MARDLFRTLGAVSWQTLADAELDKISGPRTGELLTPAEQRVAELDASGRTSREVAAELFISVRTVEAQLASIYRKLGVRGRVAMVQRLNAD